MKINRVTVSYKQTGLGLRELKFAYQFAHQLGVRLSVLLPLLRNGETERAELKAVLENRIFQDLETRSSSVEFQREDPRSNSIARNTIHVGNTCPANVIFLRSYDESHFKHGPDNKIFVPFGKGGAGQRSARYGIALAKVLNMPVVFYHVTYRVDAIVSELPEDHQSKEAKSVQALIEGIAKSKEVPFATIVEIVPNVAEGIILSALNNNASLIVMTHGRQVLVGSYVDQVAELGPVPLMSLPREVE